MAFQYKSLADGQLPNAKGTLYTAPDEASIQTITLVLSAGGPHTVNIYLKRQGSSSRLLIPPNLPMDVTDPAAAALVDVLDRPLELSQGDEIEGDCSTATVVDYSITGAER